jgi:hypothetical protein
MTSSDSEQQASGGNAPVVPSFALTAERLNN